MEYAVGISHRDMCLRALIETRLSSAPHEPKLVGEQSGYVVLECEGKEQLFTLSDILADIIIENLQIRYIMRELVQHFFYVAECDQYSVLVNTLKRIWYGGKMGDLEHAKKDIGNRVAMCLLEGKEHKVLLDGIMRFRMKDCIHHWRDILQATVDEYLAENEEAELVRLLRYFASMTDPQVKLVVIVPRPKHYDLYDGCGVLIKSPPQIDSSIEDVLISNLIHLSPEAIDVSSVDNEELIRILKLIFVGRIRE